MKFHGKAFTFGNDVDTDAIIPARYLNDSDPGHLGKHCMEDADPSFSSKVRSGDIIVAGKNFGCGSSREHAPIAIKACGVSCVIASSFARIFFRNSFNMGLPIFESGGLCERVTDGDVIEVDAERGCIRIEPGGAVLAIEPIPPFMQRLLADGGLMGHLARKAAERVEGGRA